MQQWEYLHEVICLYPCEEITAIYKNTVARLTDEVKWMIMGGIGELEAYLNQRGRQGWEMFSVIRRTGSGTDRWYEITMKRPMVTSQIGKGEVSEQDVPWAKSKLGTHWEDCYLVHHECAIAMVQKLQKHMEDTAPF